jgi:hypothetical protein
MDLHMDRDGKVRSCYITTEFSDGMHFVIHASRDGFHVHDADVTAKERLPQENPALWSFIQSPPEKP